MRYMVAVVALAFLASGCASQQPSAPAKCTDEWRVYPLPTSERRSAILLNTRSGDTWYFDGDSRWYPIDRKEPRKP